jgi:hypothetical protein
MLLARIDMQEGSASFCKKKQKLLPIQVRAGRLAQT